jgi:hypothetical protein
MTPAAICVHRHVGDDRRYRLPWHGRRDTHWASQTRRTVYNVSAGEATKAACSRGNGRYCDVSIPSLEACP